MVFLVKCQSINKLGINIKLHIGLECKAESTGSQSRPQTTQGPGSRPHTCPQSRVKADVCGQDGAPVVVSIKANLKKPLTEDILLLYKSLIKSITLDACHSKT